MNYLWKFITEHQVLFSTVIATMGFGLNMIYTSFYNHQIDGKLTNIQNQTIHARIDAYATGMAKFRDAAYKIEVHAKELEVQNEQLIECIKQKNCEKYPQLLKAKDRSSIDILKSYEIVQENLEKINQKME